MKKHILFIIALISNVTSFAGIYIAGEITYKNVSGLTYEITVTTYTNTLDTADRPQVIINLGDGSSLSLPRIVKINLPYNITRNTYVSEHNYPGPDTYIVSFEDTFRTDGILNIPNSGTTGFYLQSVIVINAFLGVNNSPDFQNIPFGIAYIDSIYIYNPSAIDIDGDSISYKLIPCGGSNIIGYTYPSASNIFSLDSLTGDLYWDSPIIAGDYNIAMLIEEWRYGSLIGSTVRDMRIRVESSSGIESFSDSSILNIFPNPTHDRIKIITSTNEKYISELIDNTGKVILSKEFNHEQIIDIAALANGFYLLRLTNNKEIITRQIIKE